MLRKGENAFGVAFASNRISFEIFLEFADGSSQRVLSGPGCLLLKNGGPLSRLWRPEIYEFGGKGEVYDARAELRGWDSPGFHAENWREIQYNGYAPEKLSAQMQSVKVFEELSPVEFRRTADGTVVADFGRNLNGHERIRFRGGKRGDAVRIHRGDAGDVFSRFLKVTFFFYLLRHPQFFHNSFRAGNAERS